ncbi:MAG: subclass B3 metallo-beta-lactamase [Gammaproteobacteria bacterium]|nr:subclass B3 metallo-beta-lactamase [Gammaproteobacteria bacterium]
MFKFALCNNTCGLFVGMYLSSLLVACSVFPKSSQSTEQSQKNWSINCERWDDWDKAGPPFRILGNTYYVGTCGIAAVLITSEEGHILIDGGTEKGADTVISNIQTLGFLVEDVKVLLHSHEHFDHVAGLAEIQKQSGALLYASNAAAPVLESGISSEQDPQAGMHQPFPSAKVNRIINDGDVVIFSDLKITAIATPGHTPGALSWQWQSCENDFCSMIVYADSLSAISRDDYYFSDHPEYINNFRGSIEKLKQINCELIITPHPSASMMHERLSSSMGLVSQESCSNYFNHISNRLNKRLEKERQELEQKHLIN